MSKSFCLWIFLLLIPAGFLAAEMCTADAVPAATLLLPYFEVDLANENGITTLFSINNATSAPALAHVTMWTNWTKPTIDFDVFLTGFDVQTVNLRDIFNGQLPITADLQTDPDPPDGISPHGLNPMWDGSFTNCSGFFPFDESTVSAANLSRLRGGHTGKPIPELAGLCLGEPSFGDDIARGSITIDSVSECSTDFANDVDYFVDGGSGVANNNNVLWGDFFMVDNDNNFAFGENLVAIEADDNFNAGSTPTGYTFYGRFTQAIGGADNREPLGTTWAHRYLNGGAFDGGTDLIVWRDNTNSSSGPEACTQYAPVWAPLNETAVVALDEMENAVEICFSRGGGRISPPDPAVDPPCFPLCTQRSAFGKGDLSVPFDAGWCFLNLNIDDTPNATDTDFGANGDIAQSYVLSSLNALGRFQVGLQATEFTTACADINFLPLNNFIVSPGFCGDGIIGPGEECDDGNRTSTDACTNSCRRARCGDGIRWIDREACDDGNESNNDSCDNACNRTPFDPICDDQPQGTCAGGACLATDSRADVLDPFSAFHPDGDHSPDTYCDGEDLVCNDTNGVGVCRRCGEDTMLGCPCGIEKRFICDGLLELNLSCFGGDDTGWSGSQGFCWDNQDGPPFFQCREGCTGRSDFQGNANYYCDHDTGECVSDECLLGACPGANLTCCAGGLGCDQGCSMECGSNDHCGTAFGYPDGFECVEGRGCVDTR